MNAIKRFFSDISAPQRVFLVFLCVHFTLWTLLPLLKTTMHPDSLEAINWGLIGGWVNDKHPPLSGFLANFFWQIGWQTDISIYILAQICMIIAFVYVYRLGRLIFDDERKAVLSAMLLGGVLYYAMTASDQFNCNIVSIPLWAATAFYVYRAIYRSNATDLSRRSAAKAEWIFAGIAVGLNMLNKYSAIFQVIGIGAYMLTSPAARAQLRRPWPYVGAIVAAIIFAPHVVALWQSRFISLMYLNHNTITNSPFLRFIEPESFTLSLIAAAALSIVIYLFAVRGAERATIKNRDAGTFLLMMILVPFAALVADAVIMNLEISTMWGIPLLILCGTALVYFWPRKIDDHVWRRAIIGVYIAMAVFASISLGHYIFNNSRRIHFDHNKFATDMDAAWRAQTRGAPMKFVRGDTWFASIMSLYGPQHPRTIFDIDGYYKKELNAENLGEYGILLVGLRTEEIAAQLQILGRDAPVMKYDYTNKNMLGRGKDFQMFYSIVPPEAKE
ncbi:MAG: glycosyltransferase family 39 protein [Proteobacteria bacterium]|nr:glycosyltransferase family 39 protein [Pseudomonadota bacterium]